MHWCRAAAAASAAAAPTCTESQCYTPPSLTPQGVHYRESERPPPPLRALPQGLTASTSLHALQQLSVDWGYLDYALLSPVYDSISKPGYAAAFPHQQLAEALHSARVPVYALGGVTAARLPELRQLGFAGAAVLGGVWSSDDPVAALQQLQTAL